MARVGHAGVAELVDAAFKIRCLPDRALSQTMTTEWPSCHIAGP